MTNTAKIELAKEQPVMGVHGQGVKFKITNATVMYVKNIGYGAPKYGEKAVEGKPWVNHQYEMDILISPEIKKVLRKAHKPTSIKEFTAEEFKKTFKIDPPFEADEYIVTKFYKEAYWKSGSSKGDEAPRINFKKMGTLEDLNEVGIGNGSVASFLVEVKHYKNDFGTGTSARLGSVYISDLVPFEVGGSNDDAEFDTTPPPEEESSGGGDDDEWDS
jgi:hypothetical protein